MILGGAGSLDRDDRRRDRDHRSNQVPDSTAPPNNGRVLFYVVLIAALLLTMKTWPKLAAVLGGTVVFGLVVHAIVGALWSSGTDGPASRRGGFLGRRDRALGAAPAEPDTGSPSAATCC